VPAIIHGNAVRGDLLELRGRKSVDRGEEGGGEKGEEGFPRESVERLGKASGS